MADTGPVRTFLSYAHEDSEWCKDVLRHVGWLRHSGQIAAFHDRELKPGERWDDRIKGELAAAEIVIALISPNFMDSRYCCLDELQPAIDRHDRGEADLVPIVCDHVDLGPLTPHQCLPQDDKNDLKPLRDWDNPNLPLAKCAAKIRALVEARRPPPAAPRTTPPPAAPPPPPRSAGLSGRMAMAVTAGLAHLVASFLRTARGPVATTGLPLPPLPSPVPPAPTPSAPAELFLGRRTDLDQLVLWLLDEDPAPIAVLGPGGIGKTALTRAALRDARCVERFSDRRLFVPLEAVRDAVGMFQAVAQALGLAADRPEEQVLAALRAAPTLLVLDNAETPWEADREEAERAFARLAAAPGISLVASFRGYELPGGSGWRPLIVEPLAGDASRALFLAVAGERFAVDPALPELLGRLDGLPLAIELVAHRAREELDAATVLRQWQAQRGRYPLRDGGRTKDRDLATSIALSLASPRMTETGRRLFAMLGRLPQGLAPIDLDAVLPGCGIDAAKALTRTGLIHRDPERLRMLAPVRDHATDQPLPPADAEALACHFESLAESLPWRNEDPVNHAAAARARAELANIESVTRGAAEAAPNADVDQRGWRWVRIGDSCWTAGGLASAERAYAQAEACFATLVTADPGNAEWQRDRSVSWDRLGDVRSAQGDLPGALAAFTESKNIRDKLAAADSGNVQWQRDLSVSWNKLGDVRSAQGDLPGALAAFTESKNIRDRLAAADPGNAEWQRDLSVSWNKLGDVRSAQGDLPGALAAFTESKNIRDRLAAADPGNAKWQRDLSVSWERLGDVRSAQGDLPGALAAFTESKNIADRLAAADSGNAEWQRDLSVSWNKLGDVRSAQGDLPGALAAFTESKNIRDRLAAADPGNAKWQRDLSVSWERLGDVRSAQGDLPGALAAFTESKNIADRLAAADSGNAEWQRDLSVSWNKLGDVRSAQGDLPGALAAFTESKNIRDRLAAADPGNAKWQRDLSVSWERLASALQAKQDNRAALTAWRSALAISERLARDFPGSVDMLTTQVVHLAGVARHLDHADPAARGEAMALLDRALAVLRPLADAGRLDATRQGWIAWLERKRADLADPTDR